MKETTRAILVDDEEGARDVLENLLGRFCPEVELLGKFTNLPEAVAGVKKLRPQIVFLDIEMPNYAGHEIIEFFDEIDFEIIFVTAYNRYAVKAFEVAAADYLLKPVDISRLKEAVAKAKSRISAKVMARQYEILKESLRSDSVKNLVIAEKGEQHIVPAAEIIAIEAQEAYSRIHIPGRTYVASRNLKHFESLLEQNKNFFRSHKSWIINLDLILRYSKSKGEIQLDHDITARLSKYKKDEFEALLRSE